MIAAVIRINNNRLAIDVRIFEDPLGDFCLNLTLNMTLHRTGTKIDIRTKFDDPVHRRIDHFQLDVAVAQTAAQLVEELIRNLTHHVLVQRIEDNDLINTVDKLRLEELLNRFLLVLLTLFLVRIKRVLRTKVAGHDDDRILEVNGHTLGIRHPAIIENLQQNVEHIRMRLLDLIE